MSITWGWVGPGCPLGQTIAEGTTDWKMLEPLQTDCPCAGDDGLEDAEPLKNTHQAVPAQETTVWKRRSPWKPSPDRPCAGDDGLEDAEPLETLTRPSLRRRRRFGRSCPLLQPHQQFAGWVSEIPFSSLAALQTAGAPRDTTVSSKPSTPGPGVHPNHQLPGLGDDGFIQTINSRAWQTTVSSKPSTPGPGASGRRRCHPNHQLPGLGYSGGGTCLRR